MKNSDMKRMIRAELEVPDVVENRMNDAYRTLGIFQTASPSRANKIKRNFTMKKFAMLTAVFCMILVLSTAALAATGVRELGIFDFISNRYEATKDAKALVTTPSFDAVQPVAMDGAPMFVVRETVFDGETLMIVVAVSPPDDKTLLLGADTDTTMRMAELGGIYAGNEQIIADFLATMNMTAMHTNVGIQADSVQGGNGMISMDWQTEDNGTLVYLLKSRCNVAGKLKLNTVYALDINGTYTMDDIVRGELSVDLASAPESIVMACDTPQDYTEAGARINKVVFTKTPLAAYVDIQYSWLDKVKQEAQDGGLWFEVVDEKGNRIEFVDGFVEDPEGWIKLSVSSNPLNHDVIMLRAYNAWTKGRYETHEFKMN